MIFDLIKDFADVLDAMPKQHPRYRILKLLDEAVRRDVHFIDRHPTTFFQCMWNTCWWYDCPGSADLHRETGDPTASKLDPAQLAETWGRKKQAGLPGFSWIRSLRPPAIRLGFGQSQVFKVEDSVRSIAVSPNGHCVAAGLDSAGVKIWELGVGREVHHLPSSIIGAKVRVCYSNDGRYLISIGIGSRGGLQVWGTEDGARRRVLDDQQIPQWCLDTSPAMPWVAVGYGVASTNRSRDSSLRIYNFHTGEEIHSLIGHDVPVYSTAFSPDGRLVASASQNDICLWDALTGKLLGRLKSPTQHIIRSLAFSPDGRTLAHGPCLFDVERGVEVRRLEGQVRHSAWLGNGKCIIAATREGAVHVWESATGRHLRQFPRHRAEITGLACIPGQNRAATSGSFPDSTVRV